MGSTDQGISGTEPSLLPGVITAVEPQKKRKDRYSIFADDQFVLGVSGMVLRKFNLRKGETLTADRYHQIRQAENQQMITDYFYRLLARRDYSRKELLNRARKKGYPDSLTNPVLDSLEQQGELDELRFAKNFIHDKLHLGQWGPRKIKGALIQKGIRDHRIDAIIDEAFSEVDRLQLMRKLVDKRKYFFAKESDGIQRKRKIFNYLQQKGFFYNTISEYIDELVDDI